MVNRDTLTIAGRTFHSRLIVGTGKYQSHPLMVRAHEASGTEMVTLAVRRVNISDRSKESLLDFIDTEKYSLLPNTAGCYTADEAVRTAHLGREAGLSSWVKLEVIGDQKTLFPEKDLNRLKPTFILEKFGTFFYMTVHFLMVCRSRIGNKVTWSGVIYRVKGRQQATVVSRSDES